MLGVQAGRTVPGRSLGPAAALILSLSACGSSNADPDVGVDVAADVTVDTAPVDTGPPPTPTPLSVATWNVENLFDNRNDPNTFDEVPSLDEVNAKLTAVGRVLRGLDVDVIVLQEVENSDILERLATEQLADAGYDHRGLEDAGDPRGIDVAYLSRLPVTRVVSHKDELFSSSATNEVYGFARDALELFVEAAGHEVVIVTTHLRAKTDGAEADDHRLAEAEKIARIVDTRLSLGSARLVIAGDMNDTPGSPPLDAVLSGGLLDVTTTVPSNDRWTFTFRGRQEQIDYVLASPDMANEVLSDGVSIVHGAEVDAASDHAPVVARFVVQP